MPASRNPGRRRDDTRDEVSNPNLEIRNKSEYQRRKFETKEGTRPGFISLAHSPFRLICARFATLRPNTATVTLPRYATQETHYAYETEEASENGEVRLRRGLSDSRARG
jgi:hypothetical protein